MKYVLKNAYKYAFSATRTAALLVALSGSLTIQMAALEEIKSPAHFQQVRAQHPLLAVKFYSPNCSACKKIAPFVEKLSQEYPQVHFVAVNDDDNRLDPIEKEFDVDLVPKLIFISAKTGTHEFYGKNLEKLRETFKPLIHAEETTRKPSKKKKTK